MLEVHNNFLPEMPTSLSDEAITQLGHLQAEHSAVSDFETSAVERRGALLYEQYKFVRTYGPVSISAYAKSLGFTYEAASLVFHVSAQVLLNVNVGTAATTEQKDARQNAVRPLAYALAALDRWHDEHGQMTREEFIAYYRVQGCMTGLRDRYLADNRRNNSNKVKRSSGAGSESSVPQSAEQIVETIFDNPAAKEIPALPDIATGTSGLMMFRQEGEKIRLVVLNATPDKMATLSGLAPSALENAPVDLRFHREMFLTGAAIVPDTMSSLTREDVPEGDEPNETYTLLPANGIYLVEGDHISIAHARREDGLIVHVEPKDYRPDYMGRTDLFMDNLTRRRLGAALTGEKDAEAFARSAKEGEAAVVQRRGKTTTMTFKNKDSGEAVNLIVKARTMGSIWTYRVSPDFSPTAHAILDENQVAEVEKVFLRELLKKMPKDRTVSIEVAAGVLGLANGKAAAMTFKADVDSTAKLSVMADDLRKALVSLCGLKRVGGMTFRLDPKGLLSIEATTVLARYRVYIQSIEPARDEPTRSRALRQRVESLPEPEASANEAAA